MVVVVESGLSHRESSVIREAELESRGRSAIDPWPLVVEGAGRSAIDHCPVAAEEAESLCYRLCIAVIENLKLELPELDCFDP